MTLTVTISHHRCLAAPPPDSSVRSSKLYATSATPTQKSSLPIKSQLRVPPSRLSSTGQSAPSYRPPSNGSKRTVTTLKCVLYQNLFSTHLLSLTNHLQKSTTTIAARFDGRISALRTVCSYSRSQLREEPRRTQGCKLYRVPSTT